MLPRRKLSRSLLLPVAMLLAFLPPTTPALAADIRATEVSFPSAGQVLHGTVVAPAAGGSGMPAMVLVAGAGATTREAYRPQAEAFARAGLVTLIYDKRAGYSRATTSFDDLATDALAGVQLLRGRPEADPRLVGLWGHSQGGWVVPVAATRSADVAFVVTVGASGLRPDRAQLWSNRTYLAHAGVADRLAEPIGTRLSRVLIAAGMFGDTRTDPAANLTRLRQPLLAVFGEHDRSTAPGESLTIFRQALEQGGNRHYTLRVVPGADHNLRPSSDGYAGGEGLAAGYVELVTSWIKDLATGAPVSTADAPPAQTLASEPIRPPAWHESPALHLAAFSVMLLAFAAYVVGAIVSRLRGRRPASGEGLARWAPLFVVACGGLAVLGTAGYLFLIVATGSTAVDTTVLGRPPWWLALQLLAVLAVAAAAVLVVTAWRARHVGGRRGVLLAGALVFVPWAAYWGLLTP